MGNGIPDGITADDIVRAIQAFDAGALHDFGESTGYDLLYEGRRYPPKAIIGLAARRIAGRVLGPYDFKGGLDSQCFTILEGAGFEVVPKDAEGETWSVDEFRAAVAAYMAMLAASDRGESVNKAEVNRQLRAGALRNRSKGSIEYRMQNISAVLEAMGARWMKGYKPMQNVGAAARQQILDALRAAGGPSIVDFLPAVQDREVEERTRALRRRRSGLPIEPLGAESPEVSEGTVKRYARLPAVRAWVLDVAAGRCELCDTEAPFLDADGLPYLEVHHVVTLAEGGPDTTWNAVAICPNCHRRLHLAQDRRQHVEAAYAKVARLKRPRVTWHAR